MPFINIKVAGEPLAKHQITALQKSITGLMVEILHKVGPLVGVLVEQVQPDSWSVGAEQVKRAAQVDAIVSAGTNTPEQKARFIAEVNGLLRTVLGTDLAEVTYVVVHEVAKDSWGYNGLTQEHRARPGANCP
jgi:4-oxalocrotonate tautomerase